MPRHPEQFFFDKKPLQQDMKVLRESKEHEADPYPEWREMDWLWLQGLNKDRQEMLSEYQGRVHVRTSEESKTADLPPDFEI